MRHSKQAEEIISLMNIAEEFTKKEIENMGPGVKTHDKTNVYTREEVKQMLEYMYKFVKEGKQLDSWKYGQEWLNVVGKTMEKFLNLKPGDPALDYKEGEIGGDVFNLKDR